MNELTEIDCTAKLESLSGKVILFCNEKKMSHHKKIKENNKQTWPRRLTFCHFLNRLSPPNKTIQPQQLQVIPDSLFHIFLFSFFIVTN